MILYLLIGPMLSFAGVAAVRRHDWPALALVCLVIVAWFALSSLRTAERYR